MILNLLTISISCVQTADPGPDTDVGTPPRVMESPYLGILKVKLKKRWQDIKY